MRVARLALSLLASAVLATAVTACSDSTSNSAAPTPTPAPADETIESGSVELDVDADALAELVEEAVAEPRSERRPIRPANQVWAELLDRRAKIEEILGREFVYVEEMEEVAAELLRMRRLEREIAISARKIDFETGLRISRTLGGLKLRLASAANAAEMQSPPMVRQALREFDFWIYQMEDNYPDGTLDRSITEQVSFDVESETPSPD